MECRKQKAQGWAVRLQEEVRAGNKAEFITLTFSDESLVELEKEVLKENSNAEGYELENAIATKAVRRFLERWRKKYKTSIKHWLVTELGGHGTERIHIHGILWTEKREAIEERWKYGWVYLGEYVNERTVNYIVKYINKVDKKHENYNPKILTSAGIGNKYMTRLDAELCRYKKNGETRENYTTRQGIKLGMPIYMRNKLYSEEERERLWIEKLDKEERWVLGKKIKVSEGYEEYYKALEEARKKNKRLGYGSNEKEWKKEEYERARRRVERGKREEKIREQKKDSDLAEASNGQTKTVR
jgi:hypothetical protein